MVEGLTKVETEGASLKTAARLGFWIALLTAATAALAFALAVTTPPRSGPFCAISCMAYPYAGAAAFVPRDYRWMYPAILLTPLFAVLMACVHAGTGESRRVFSRISLCFATISAALITADYLIQIEVMQPSLLKGEFEGLALFSQYNPHGIFIALEDLGYMMMSAAFLFAGQAFSRGRGVERGLRWVFPAASLLAFAAYLGMSLFYGANIEYRFEVTVITVNWTALLIAGILLSVRFRPGAQDGPD